MAPLSGNEYSKILRQSLYILPLLILIGIFNPFIYTQTAFEISGIDISVGWLTFISILLRGLLAIQALIIMVDNSGFIEICNALRSIGVPKILTTQLLMVYRYMSVLLQEVDSMHCAVVSRGFGKKSFPIKFWGTFTGSLLIRTYERSKRIHSAMLARGFNGSIPLGKSEKWGHRDFFFSASWITVFIFLYFFNLSSLIFPDGASFGI